VVDVVGEPDRNAALDRGVDRVLDDGGDRRWQVDVVDRDLERVLRGPDEVGQRVRDIVGRLAAVRQRPDVDRIAALCARFAAW
jgi:hypothetical protein